jgi:hypothetical protein
MVSSYSQLIADSLWLMAYSFAAQISLLLIFSSFDYPLLAISY